MSGQLGAPSGGDSPESFRDTSLVVAKPASIIIKLDSDMASSVILSAGTVGLLFYIAGQAFVHPSTFVQIWPVLSGPLGTALLALVANKMRKQNGSTQPSTNSKP